MPYVPSCCVPTEDCMVCDPSTVEFNTHGQIRVRLCEFHWDESCNYDTYGCHWCQIPGCPYRTLLDFPKCRWENGILVRVYHAKCGPHKDTPVPIAAAAPAAPVPIAATSLNAVWPVLTQGRDVDPVMDPALRASDAAPTPVDFLARAQAKRAQAQAKRAQADAEEAEAEAEATQAQAAMEANPFYQAGFAAGRAAQFEESVIIDSHFEADEILQAKLEKQAEFTAQCDAHIAAIAAEAAAVPEASA